jgi:aerobic carbon-monoxide dehydrogenase large subunit
VATFLRDHHPPGVLWLTFARSTVAHAVLRGVDRTRAADIDRVHEVVTAEDLPSATDMIAPLSRDGQPMRSSPRPLLARDRIRFYGEPIAAVLAAGQYEAFDAAAAVHADTEPLPVVTDALKAMSPGAPLLFQGESNLLFTESDGWEEAEEALACCSHTVSREFRVGRYTPVPLETRAVLAVPEGDGVTVWSSTQAPAQLRRAIMDSLDLPEEAVRVVASRVGGGFGQKAHAHPEEVLSVLLALRAGRPVKWLESRIESVQASSHARDALVCCQAGYDDDGRLRVLLCDVISDVGAYGMWPHGYLLEALGTAVAMPGAYDLDAFGYRTRAVATNKCPGGALRGVGFAVATFVRERMVEIMARERGEDAVSFRLRNCQDAGAGTRMTATGLELRGEYSTVLRRAEALLEPNGAVASGQGTDGNVLVGSGYALYVEPVSPGSLVFAGRGMAGIVGYDEARVAIDGDGHVSVVTSSPDIGQGSETTYGQVVAQALGCSRQIVHVDPADTRLDGTGTFASRSAASVAVACEQAARILRERVLELAAEAFGIPTERLEIQEARVVVAGTTTPALSFAELRERAPAGALEVTQRTDPGAGGVAYGAHACTVAVDVRTGTVDVLRYVVVEDCGEMINPGVVRNQTLGGVAQALGLCFLERLEYDADGRPLADGFASYRVPRAADAPDCQMSHVGTEATRGRRLGVGEGGAVATAGALANAVSAALGAEVNSMPFDPSAVWQLHCDRTAHPRQPVVLSERDH